MDGEQLQQERWRTVGSEHTMNKVDGGEQTMTKKPRLIAYMNEWLHIMPMDMQADISWWTEENVHLQSDRHISIQQTRT